MKRAPFLCKQSPDRTLEVVILAGSLAWETSHVWRKDPDREDDVPPMVLGPDELADLSNLTIIRPDTLYVRVLRTGDISEEELLKIAVKLAHAGVQMARLMTPDGELLENWTGQLERLRQERPSDILPDHFRLDEEALAEIPALKRGQLLAEVRNVLLRHDAGMHVVLDGVVLGRQTKRVVADGIKHVVALHAALARNHIHGGVAARMTHVQACAAGIRELH